MTAPTPYLPATPDLIRGSHDQRTVLTISDGVKTWTMGALSGTLTLSEDWSPFGQFTATVANTFTPEDLAALDPRKKLTVTLSAGYVHPDGTADLHPVFTGQLDGRLGKQPAGILDLRASTAETLAQEARWLAAATWKTFAGVTEALEWLAGYATGAAVTMASSVGYLYRPDLVASIPLAPGQQVWDVMASIALSAGVRLYVDVNGAWTMAPKATTAATTATYLSTGNGGIVDTADDELSRDGYYGAAVLTYQWRDAASVDHTMIGTYGAPGAKTFTDTLPTPVTQSQANAAAQATVANLSTRGDSYTCTAVAVYWLRPGDTVEVTLADGTTARHIVKAVTFQYTAGTMTVTTREPTNLGA